MPILPDATALGERPTPQPSSGAAGYTPVNTGAPLAQGLASAGREMQEAASIVDATNDAQDRIAAAAGMNALQQQRMNLEFDPKAGFRNIKQGGAVGQPFVDTYMAQFDDATKKVSDSLQNERQKKLFAQRAPVVSLQYRSALMQHQAAETDRFNDSTANGTIELALRTMAQRPTDELNFQTAMVQIDATVEDVAKRKGLPEAEAKALKGKYLDAAYSTRILSVLDGVPGVVPSSPYMAEKMLRQVQDQLGPQAILTLSRQVLSGVKEVQQRDGARAEVFGGGALDARALYPATSVATPLANVVLELESRGKRFGADGQLLTSPKGAKGEMQVMPATSKDPGFGVTPARDDSPEELARVGRDYIGAMTARYGDPALALAAYNAGPGEVDRWLGKYGDPRTGQISAQDWIAKIPFAETQKYVTAGLRKVLAADPAPVSGPTANQIRAEALPALLERARSHAEAMYPDDPRFVDGYVTRTLQYANGVLAEQQAKQKAAQDTLTQALVGQKGDGSDAVKTIDQALANPAVKAAFEASTPDAQLAFQTRLAKGDKRFDEASFGIYYGLLGAAGNDPPGFAQADLTQYFGLIPDEKLVELSRYQKSINSNDAKQQQRDLNWTRAKSNVEDMLKPLGLGTTAKANSEKSKVTEQFYGRLNEAMQQYFDTNKAWPPTQDTRKMAASLLTEGKQAGGLIWDSGKRAFEVDNQGQFYVPLPAIRTTEYAALTQTYQRVYKRLPSDADLRVFYTRWRLEGNK